MDKVRAFSVASRSIRIAALAVGCWPALGPAGRADDGADPAPGVNPKDNISKIEMLVKHDELGQADSTRSLTVKLDQAFTASFGGNVETPFVTFQGFGRDDAGLGDIQTRVRYNRQAGAVTLVTGLELVLPTASEDTLGRGKVQLNPVAGVVAPLSPTSFLFLGYKQFLSVTGDRNRADINESQPRAILGYTDPAGWWLLGDAKYTRSWVGAVVEQVDLEVEYGRMLAPSVGIWMRAGTSLLDSDRDAGVLFGVRLIR